MAHLRKIRECIMPVRLGETWSDYGDMIMRRIMSACVNILSISVAQYSHDLQNKYGSEERGMYLDIIESFGMYHFGAEIPSDIGWNGKKAHECYPAD
jgi:hypothetical protein